MDAYIATTTALGTSVGTALFSGAMGALNAALPWMIGFTIFWFVFGLVRRMIGGV